MSPLRAPHALLAGGGTGGHVFPGLAVGEELRRRGWEVSATGLAQGIEARLAAAAGFPFHPLPARPLVGRGLMGKANALATVARGGTAAAALVRRLGIDAVLGTGGYVSAPAVLGARLARRPVLLLEPNARAGVANRWLSRWATAAAVAYRETISDLKCPCWVTGVPVREAFFRVPGALPPIAPPAAPPRLLVLGGSQGAQQVNRTLPAALAQLRDRLPTLHVLHQAGARHADETRQLYADAGFPAGVGERVEVVPFLDDVAGAMAACHLLVSRAGAITVAEICAAGRASLLLPLAIAQGHQNDNARLLAEAGGAEVLTADEATPERLAGLLGDLLGDLAAGGTRLAQMGRAVRTLARPNAVRDIAGRLEDLLSDTTAGAAGSDGEAR